jgi:DNA-binding CsgD family transcriptional regulator
VSGARIVEAAYDLDASPDAWLASVTTAIAELGRARGVALEFDAHREFGDKIVRVAAPSFSAREERWIRRAFTSPVLDRGLTGAVGPIDAFPAISRLSERGVGPVELSRFVEPFAARLGFDDLVGVVAHDGSRRGVLVNLVVEARWRSPPAMRSISLALPHVSAGLRVRGAIASLRANDGRPYGAEVILDEGGRVRDGEVGESDRDLLRSAVVARDRARMRGTTDDALEAWTALVDGRWSLLDVFERSGKRYVVAVPNLPDVRSPHRLAPVERAVLALVLLGRSNKAVAYELGLAEGTVAAYLREARRKLDAPLRELPTASARVEWTEVGDVELAAIVTDVHATREELLRSLTPTERAVVARVLDGLATRAIATSRGTSERTIANQLASAYRKLGVGSRRELAAKLAARGIASPPRRT